MHLQECGGEEKGRNTRGVGWGEVMSAGARRACEWSTEIRPKAS
jgi:hypothetical protein